MVNTVRPFTVNSSNTLAFTSATEFDGFQVSSITTGKVLFAGLLRRLPRRLRVHDRQPRRLAVAR